MRADHRMQRLFVPDALGSGAAVLPSDAQTHYLLHVLRMEEGGELLLFNGRDGEWLARVAARTKRGCRLDVAARTRPQTPAGPLRFCFAPLKQSRLDYLVQKAVEMGAGSIEPVMTQHTQTATPKRAKMEANAIEAAEQCGVLSLPRIAEAARFSDLVEGWPRDLPLIFCDEAADSDNPLPILRGLAGPAAGLLVGPEGGFSDAERQTLRALPFVAPIPLGPRILRADTAAVAALALVQATLGDWR